MKRLIDKQTISIDNHGRGTREALNWDDSAKDVHLDKKTNTRIGGRLQKVRIKIPINSSRSISVTNQNGEEIEIPRRLRNEIMDAFADELIRRRFVVDLVDSLKNFESNLSDREKAKQALTNISKHFGLELPIKTVETYVDDVLKFYALLFKKDNKEYFAEMDSNKIVIGQYSGYAKRCRNYYKQ